MLTMMNEDDSVSAAMRAGARGYVLKGVQPAEIPRDGRGGQRPGYYDVATGMPSAYRLRTVFDDLFLTI
jgi:hypothetical protein